MRRGRSEFDDRFVEALNNDLNTAQALAVVLELVAEAYRRKDKRIWNTLQKFDAVLGLDLEAMRKDTRGGLPPEIAALQRERDAARAARISNAPTNCARNWKPRATKSRIPRRGSTMMPPQRRRLEYRAVALSRIRERPQRRTQG